MRSYAKYNYRDKFKEDGMDKESSMGVWKEEFIGGIGEKATRKMLLGRS
jgi:hypothetical protein